MAHSDKSGSWAILPAVVSTILTLIWAAYTVLVLVEIFSTPTPAM